MIMEWTSHTLARHESGSEIKTDDTSRSLRLSALSRYSASKGPVLNPFNNEIVQVATDGTVTVCAGSLIIEVLSVFMRTSRRPRSVETDDMWPLPVIGMSSMDAGTSISSSTFLQPPQVNSHDSRRFVATAPERAFLVKRWKQARNMKRPTPERNTLYERRFTHRSTGMSMSAQEVDNDQ
jgi:hypothetical protein